MQRNPDQHLSNNAQTYLPDPKRTPFESVMLSISQKYFVWRLALVYQKKHAGTLGAPLRRNQVQPLEEMIP